MTFDFTDVRLRAADRAELLAEVAQLYYVEGCSQLDIAERLGMSRSNISRLLNHARQSGIVMIRIAHPLSTVPSLEDELRQQFGLDTARILAFSASAQAPSRTLEKVGRLAAEHVMETVRDGDIIGISWGTSIQHTVDALDVTRLVQVEVVQLLGGLSHVSPTISGHELARRTGAAFGAPYHYLHAPAIVASRAIRDSLLADPSIQRVLSIAARSTLALVGIGTMEAGSSKLLLEEAGLTAAEYARLRDGGAVGDICSRHFDLRGRPCAPFLDARVVGVDLESLRAIPNVIGVAAGVAKAPALLGALRGGWLNALVSDEAAAREVLRLARQTS